MADQITHISSTDQPDEGEGDDVQVSENEEHLNSLQTTHFLEENSSEEDSSEEDSSEEDSSEEEGEEQRVSAADEQEDVKEAKDNVEQVSEAEDEANESSEEEDSSEEEEENEEQVAEAPDQPNTMPDEDDLNKNKEEKDEKIPEAKDQADVLPDEEEKEDKHVPEVEDYTDALPEGGSHEAADERQIPEDEVSADVLSKEDEEQAIGTEEQADAAPEKDPSQEVKGTAEQVLEVEEQADALHEGESLSQEVIPPEDTENGPSDEESKGNVNEDASIQMEHMSSDEDEMSNDQIINSDATLEPHQALEMASLEETVATAESPRNKAISSSRFTSFQGKNRDERLKFMVEQAEGRAKKVRLGEGVKSVFQANMDDIGALGIGMQLYFMLTKYLSVTFLCMGIISLPAVMVNSYGQGITSKMVDPLQLAYSSIGNGGVNSDTAASARSCLPIGDIDCTWQTVNTPLTSNPKVVTWIVALTDVLYSFFFMCFLLFYSYRAKKAIKEHQNKHLTPARYAVMVRGLPTDATEKEILEHFNNLYDLTKRETYRKLWFGCWWGRRHKVRRSRSKKAVNRNVISNVDHLEGSTTINKDLYLNTWIAEVSVAHPTGGLLRTYLSTKSLGDKRDEIEQLIKTLEAEKMLSPSDFKPADEKLIHSSREKLKKIQARIDKKDKKIAVVKNALLEAQGKKKMKGSKTQHQTSKDKLSAAAHAAKTAATNTQQAFNWEACECAFVVFNNLESRRRCMQDYRQSTHWLAREGQPEELRFRKMFPLIVTSAPEPSNIMWENLEVTKRGRFYRQFVTNLVTVLLLIISCAIISAAQSTQEKFANQTPPDGLCDQSLPAVYYADTSFSLNAQKRPITWSLSWYSSQNCTLGASGEERYYVAYTNKILNDLDTTRLSYGPTYPNPERCVDPCISEKSTEVCNTLPCFYYNELVQSEGMSCEAYEASNVLYCFCSSALTNSIKTYGFIKGPKRMWDAKPCRGFTKDYLIKNSFMLFAAGIVVVVNFLLNNILRMFAVFERHSSESTRTIRVAVRMFVAQFLNTAIIVMLVNASFGLGNVKVAKELLGGKYADFERGWYPTVGMGIATTMLLNAFLPQITLFMHMYVVSPIHRWYKRRSIRTQAKMDKLYAGPTFDISQRYPMVLNSVFVTMVFCGGSPILLFIATVASAGVYWFDKLSILYLYSVKTTYDEILGKVTIQVLPWTLAMHLGFSAWMYGNTDLLKGSVLNLPWLLRSVGLKAVLLDHPNATSDELYGILTDKLGKYDVLGKHGFLVKIVFSQVMLMTILCFAVTFGLLLYIIFGKLVFVVLRQMLVFLKHVVFIPVELFHALFSKDDEARAKEAERRQQKKKEKLPVVILPEFTEPFVMSVSRRYRPDDGLGFQRCRVDNTYELTCVWPKDIVHENGVARTAGDRKLSWETMQAPVTSYAIEANEKYRYPVKQILNAWKRVKEVRREHSPEPVHLEKVTPVIAKNESHVETAVAATEIVTIVAEGKNDGDTEDALTETRPEETADSIETDAAIEPVDEEPASDSTEANGNGEVSTDTPAIETTAASAEAAQEQLVDNK